MEILGDADPGLGELQPVSLEVAQSALVCGHGSLATLGVDRTRGRLLAAGAQVVLGLLLAAQRHLGGHHPLPLDHQEATGAPAVLPGAGALVALQARDDAVVPAARALGAARSTRDRRRRVHHRPLVRCFCFFGIDPRLVSGLIL